MYLLGEDDDTDSCEHSVNNGCREEVTESSHFENREHDLKTGRYRQDRQRVAISSEIISLPQRLNGGYRDSDEARRGTFN
jgi:hypothetical protein